MSSYADTSFLVSLYVADANSDAATEWMKRVELPVVLTPLGELELANTMQSWLFRRETVESKIKAAEALVRADMEYGILSRIPMPLGTYERAKQIARRRTATLGSRTLDILHVASALLLRAEAFYTFDRMQGKLARAEGLKVVSN